MGNICYSFILIISMLLAGVFLFGCTSNSTTAQVSNGITYATGVGAGTQNIAALPAAREGQAYAATITPSGGTSPYICASVPAGSTIIGTIRLNADCTITGTAPILSSGTTHAAYPVKFTITDATGIVAGPFDLALEVIRAENQGQGQQGGVQQNNPNIPTLNLPQPLPNATVFNKYNQSFTVQGGTPPYLAMGCTWNGSYDYVGLESYIEEGTLKIRGNPREEDVGTYNISCCIFHRADTNEYSCWNTSISVVTVEETWTGAIQTSRYACYHDDMNGPQGRLDGSWTATVTVPAKLSELLANPDTFNADGIERHESTKVIWSGHETATQPCAGIDRGTYTAIGGTASNVVPRLDVDFGTKPAGLWLTSDNIDYPLLPGGYTTPLIPDWVNNDALSITLVPTSINESMISGDVVNGLGSYSLQTDKVGTFTLTRVK